MAIGEEGDALNNGLSIVIPARNEALLDWTIGNVFRTIKVPFEIHVIDDGSDAVVAPGRLPFAVARNDQARGAAASRDAGVARANFAAVLCLDAHVSFHDDDWSRLLLDHLQACPQDVCCFRCPRLDPGHLDIADADIADYGGHIEERDETALTIDDGGIVRQAPFRTLLPVKWTTEPFRARAAAAPEPIELGCILGGAYAFRREWYEDGLKAPWRRQRAWGSDEQHLSLPNWLLGGRNVLLPASIAHVYRSNAPYTTNVADILFNTLLLGQLVLPEAERAAAIAWALAPWTGHAVRDDAEALLAASDWSGYRQTLQGGTRRFEDYRRIWMAGGEEPRAAQPCAPVMVSARA